eukprot:TRINITY_DN39754_c0_g1_i2.p1 TRINITY_DN39754_c0_g1~~TRINITY_DN39754_c0_g1_i2.p1  ORF type:complete len:212 (-),score=36.85 TRINITY_DN39754_c0_g1_i2:216-764(-)
MSVHNLVLSVLIGFPLSCLARQSGPSKCELAIVRCCDRDTARVLPLRCFEVNGCPGLYWYGQKACSKSLVASALNSINKGRGKNTINENDNEKNRKVVTPKPITPAKPKKKKKPSKPSLPTACELSLVRCCDVKQSSVLPLRCFELNGCPGLYWFGRRTCSQALVSSAIASLSRKVRRKTQI